MRWIAILELQLDDKTRYYSHYQVATPAVFYSAKVLRFGSVSREIPRVPDQFRIGSISVVLDNSDLEFSKLVDRSTIRNRAATVKIGKDTSALQDFTTIYSGIISEYEIRGTEFEVTILDKLLDRLEQPVGTQLSRTKFTNLPVDQELVYPPVIYGTVTSVGKSAQGFARTIYVDNVAFKYLLCQHGVTSVLNVYRYGVLVAAANYAVVVDADGWTLLDFTSDQEDANRKGETTITADVNGIDKTNPADLVEHFLLNYCGFVSGDLDSSGFATAKTAGTAAAMVGAGTTALQRTRAEFLNQMLHSFHMDLFEDRSGKLSITLYDIGKLAGISAQKLISDALNLLPMPRLISNTRIITRLQHNYDYDHARDFFYNQPTFTDTTSESLLKSEVRRENVSLWWAGNTITATYVARLRQFFSDERAYECDCELPLEEATLDLGQILRVTHFAGIGHQGTGWVDNQVKVIGLAFDLDELKFRARLADMKARQMLILGDETKLAAKWAVASDADRRYAYLGDANVNKFSDGQEIKRLY